jgi:hypothetical protein
MSVIHHSSFAPYDASEVPEGHVFYGLNVRFCRNAKGQDWYELQRQVGSGSTVIAVDDENIVRSVATDPSMLWPEGFTVYELPGQSLGEDMLGKTFDPDTGVIE